MRYIALIFFCYCGVMPLGRYQSFVVLSGQAEELGAALAGAKSQEDIRHYAMIHPGDSQRGKELFAVEPAGACLQCHSVDDTGGKAGPDLSFIGDKLARSDLIESILWPSRTIADGYNTTTVETHDGDQYQGIIRNAADSWIELIGADTQPIRVETTDIFQRRTSEISLMPEGLQSGLTLQDFADLVEYLVSLKQPNSIDAFKLGTPAVIHRIENPIVLRPFHDESHPFVNPVWFGQVPGLHDAFLVLEHKLGRIWLLEKRVDGDRKSQFLDLGNALSRGGARGLMGLAFHPRFDENRRYFLALHIVEEGQHLALTVERQATPDLKRDSGNPSRVLLRFHATTSSHTGGGIEFGPDGYLYVGMGDTGPHEDPNGHAQNMSLLKGKMLRIDVDRRIEGQAYTIPADNPFVGRPDVRPEIWASGLREPWRFSFDPLTGELWVGDVGQDRYAEITSGRCGENHGWTVWEGCERFSTEYRSEPERYVKPIFAYPRKYGLSIIGGHVYRADRESSFYGVYIFGDHESRRIWGLNQENRTLNTILQIGMSPQRIVSFGTSETGDLYLVGYEGTIFSVDLDHSEFKEPTKVPSAQAQ